MKSAAALVVLACTVPTIMAQLMVNSLTDVVACQPAQITWQGGSPPYYVSLIPAGQPSAPPLKQFPVQNGNSLTWTVDLEPNTAFSTELKDASGAVVYSGEQTILSGSPGASCTSASPSGSGSMSATTALAASSMASSMSGSAILSASSGGFGFVDPTFSFSSGVSASMTASASMSHSSASASGTPAAGTQSGTSHGYATLGVVGLTGFLGLVAFALF